MEYHVAMTSDIGKSLQDFLLCDPRDEEYICFATWYPATGKQRLTALLHSPIFPRKGERERHGNVSALPPYVDRAKEFARSKGGGLAIIHTHPLGSGWQGLSKPDRFYERDVLSREVLGITGYPLVGMTLAGDGAWSARIYEKAPKKTPILKWCSAVRLVGKSITFYFDERFRPPVKPAETLMRTTSVWGSKLQSDIMRLRVGVIRPEASVPQWQRSLQELELGKSI